MSVSTPPDRTLFEQDLTGASYRLGEVSGRWSLVRLAWPCAYMTISAAEHPDAPQAYAFRIECSGYPTVPPTAQPWDIDANTPLPSPKWPGGRGVVADVFRPDWEQGRCLYHPCDRITINSHPDWRHQHPERLWKPDRGIVCFLEQIHDLLHSTYYSGLRRA